MLITGGTRGIGKQVALKFAKFGYNVVTNYVSEKTDEKKLKEELLAEGANDVILSKADVTDINQMEELVKKAIEKFNSIDVLVNNAGITRDNLLLRMSEEEFNKVIDVNLKGTYIVTKLVTKYMMKQRKGSVIIILHQKQA